MLTRRKIAGTYSVLHQALARVFGRLLNRRRDFVGFAVADTDAAFAISRDHQRAVVTGGQWDAADLAAEAQLVRTGLPCARELSDVVLAVVVPGVGTGMTRVVVTWTVVVAVLAGVVSAVVVVSAALPPAAITPARSTPAAKISACSNRIAPR